jgi:hypothetical protein
VTLSTPIYEGREKKRDQVELQVEGEGDREGEGEGEGEGRDYGWNEQREHVTVRKNMILH